MIFGQDKPAPEPQTATGWVWIRKVVLMGLFGESPIIKWVVETEPKQGSIPVEVSLTVPDYALKVPPTSGKVI